MKFKASLFNDNIKKEFNTNTGKGKAIYLNCHKLTEKANIHYYYGLGDIYFKHECIKNTLYVIILPWGNEENITFNKDDVYNYFLYVPADELKVLFQMFNDAMSYSYKPSHLRSAYQDIKKFVIEKRKDDFILVNMENK